MTDGRAVGRADGQTGRWAVALALLLSVSPFLIIYLGYPFLDPLRSDERFRRVVASASPGGP